MATGWRAELKQFTRLRGLRLRELRTCQNIYHELIFLVKYNCGSKWVWRWPIFFVLGEICIKLDGDGIAISGSTWPLYKSFSTRMKTGGLLPLIVYASYEAKLNIKRSRLAFLIFLRYNPCSRRGYMNMTIYLLSPHTTLPVLLLLLLLLQTSAEPIPIPKGLPFHSFAVFMK